MKRMKWVAFICLGAIALGTFLKTLRQNRSPALPSSPTQAHLSSTSPSAPLANQAQPVNGTAPVVPTEQRQREAAIPVAFRAFVRAIFHAIPKVLNCFVAVLLALIALFLIFPSIYVFTKFTNIPQAHKELRYLQTLPKQFR